MTVDITSDAIDYIKNEKNSSIVTIDLVNYGFSSGNYWEPTVSPGEPSNKSKYILEHVKDIDVYIYKEAESEPGGIKIYIQPDPYSFNWLQVSGLIYVRTELG